MTITDRDRELFREAQQRYRERSRSDISSTVLDRGEHEMTEVIAAAREEGRQEERERCERIFENELAWDGNLRERACWIMQAIREGTEFAKPEHNAG